MAERQQNLQDSVVDKEQVPNVRVPEPDGLPEHRQQRVHRLTPRLRLQRTQRFPIKAIPAVLPPLLETDIGAGRPQTAAAGRLPKDHRSTHAQLTVFLGF